MTIDRRTLLVATGAATALLALPQQPAAAAPRTTPAAAARARLWDAGRSDNGWFIDPDAVESYRIEGSPATVRLHADAAAVLLHVARRWHYEVMPLHAASDVLGHTTDRAVRTAYASNRLSGTALVLPGAGDGLWPHQTAIVRDILADCDGTVRWGLDLSPATADHFQIDVKPDSRTLGGLTAAFGAGPARHDAPHPGAPDDPATPERRKQARRLAQAQRGNG
ncbi:hypothetical protein [Streptomyces sp. NPDC048560]|uniref:hypothetical protein n=1 Tax=Streptomyces sp. NPDC048560 TaxID=3155488 RepID=UPI00341DDBE1